MSPRLGFAYGHFDVLDIDHLRYLTKAGEACDYLIVGVTTDALCERLRGVGPVVSLMQRMQLVGGLRPVREVVCLEDTDVVSAWQCLQFDVLFPTTVADQSGFEQHVAELPALGVQVDGTLGVGAVESSQR